MIAPKMIGGLEPFIEFSVANHGKVAAIVDEVIIFNCSAPSDTRPSGLPVDVDHPLKRRKILGPGDIVENIKDWVCLGNFAWKDGPNDQTSPQLPAGETYYFSVVLRYHGPFTKEHITSAYWRLDPTTNHFVEFGGDELNYIN